MRSMNWIYYTHGGLFALAAMAAFGVGLMTTHAKVRIIAWGNAVPLLVSSLTYLLQRSLAPETRWLGYTVACGFFAYETSLVLGRRSERAIFAGLLMSLTLFAGYAGYLPSSVVDTWLVFSLGSLAYACSILLIVFDERWALPNGRLLRAYLAAFVLSWSAYAVFYAVGPAGGGILSASGEELAYFVLEFPAKYGVAAANIALSARRPPKPEIY